MKKILQHLLINWFTKHQRILPWRSGYDPYHTWIAEIMMQQTQMDRGVVYYQNWIKRFPTIQSVVNAHEEELLKYWEGLGYYKRVQNIKKTAHIIINNYGGIFPNNYTSILQLPGIGAYTAGAIASTVFNEEVPCIDGNVERVLSRIFDIKTSVKKEPAKSYIYTLCKELIPKGKARDFNQALMEFGALICRKKPLCEQCPIIAFCKTRKLGTYLEHPIKEKKITLNKINMVVGILNHNTNIFIQQRTDNAIWKNLWTFPGGIVKFKEKPEDTLIKVWNEQFGLPITIKDTFTTIQHKYTTYNITLSCFIIDTINKKNISYLKSTIPFIIPGCRWVSQHQIQTIPLPSPHRKIASLYFSSQ